MNTSRSLCQTCRLATKIFDGATLNTRVQWRIRCQNTFRRHQVRSYSQPGDNSTFRSVVDDPPVLVRAGRKKHGVGIILLALMPITAFALGTWQVQRLGWKTDLMARFEDRLTRPPLPLPPQVDPSAIKDFDYRRVFATGRLRHDQEMLVGPRLFDGDDGYIIITPLERKDGSTILVSRGWIAKRFKEQRSRPEGLPQGEVEVQGLLREPHKKNMFTPDNNLEQREFYFPDIPQMAGLTGAEPVWVEETMEVALMEIMRRSDKGIPIGRAPEVNLRNNHAQYIFTWYSLCAATSIMLLMIIKKKPSAIRQRVTRNREW